MTVAAYDEKKTILVLCLGGTMNGDHRKTRKISLGEGKPATNIEVYHDDKGRTPAQIYVEDVLKRTDVDFKELAAKDSKALEDKDIQALLDEILVAKSSGYERVLVVMGTDKAVETGRHIEYACLPHPSLPVIMTTAMEEMTRDMDLDANRFVTLNTDGIATVNDALNADLPPAVHIMTANAGYADPMDVVKDFQNKQFLAKPRRR